MREGRKQLLQLAAGAAVFGVVLAVRSFTSAPALPAAPPLPPAPPPPGTRLAELEAELRAEREALAPEARARLEHLVAQIGRMGADGYDAIEKAAGAVAALPGAGAYLIAMVADEANPPLRRVDGCRLLGVLRERRAVPALGAIVLDVRDAADPHVQAAAAEALGAIGERAALVALVYALRDGRPKMHQVMRAKAIAALELGSRYGGDACVDVLQDWNADMAKRPRVFDREFAARALMAAAERAGTPVDADPSPFRLPGGLRAELDKIAAWWNAHPAAPPAPHVGTDPVLLAAVLAPYLEYLDGKSFFYRKLTQDVLVGLGADGLPYLLRALRDPRVPWRQFAAEALGDTREPAAIAHLAYAYRTDASPLVRREAVRALRKLADALSDLPAAARAPLAETLQRAREDADPGVRQAAAG